MAQSFSVTSFKSNFQLGGARPTLFQVTLTSPTIVGVNLAKTPFLIRAANLPASNLGTIPVPYYGRVLKMAGDRTFDPWTVTVINDEDFQIRDALESWSNAINQMRGNIRTGTGKLNDYKASAQVVQYNKEGAVIRTYDFEGLFPKDVQPIDLNWGSQDAIEEFQVTFEYDNWVLDSSSSTGSYAGAQGS